MCEVFSRQDPRRYQPTTRKLRLNGQSTSIRLEQAFWDIIDEIAAGEGMATPAFLSTSLLRCACLVQLELRGRGAQDFRKAAQQVAQAA